MQQIRVVKKYAYYELVKNVNTSNTSDLVNEAYLKIMKLKREILIMIIVNILLFKTEITTDNFATRLKQANIASKNNIIDFVKRHTLIKN